MAARIERAFLLALALTAGFVVQGAAREAALDPAFYRARAFVTGQGEAERARGFGLALEEVLVKVSGDPRLRRDPRLSRLEADAARLVARFDYHDRMSGIPVHDEQGTRERPFDLTVTFDPAGIDRALRALDYRPWAGPRPKLVVLLQVKDAAVSYALASDGEHGLGQRLSLAAAAEQRGVPIVLPAMAALAAAGGADRSTRVARRLGGDLALTGALVWQGQGWQARWRLAWHGVRYRWGSDAVSFDDAFRRAMDGALQILSGHGRPSAR
ncbi:MAG TPA: DUF2066 domain-containing protein [Stellaceae bacterium]|nr:DUF2066 domain-containing protein [Stellaceae bacterium]